MGVGHRPQNEVGGTWKDFGFKMRDYFHNWRTTRVGGLDGYEFFYCREI